MKLPSREQLRRVPPGFWALALGLWLWGATKPPAVSIRAVWDPEFFGRRSAVADTNDLRRVSFYWAPAVDWLPETANATLDALLLPDGAVFTVTNWPMSALSGAVTMPHDATNYIFLVGCDWTPAPSVVTNGVYRVRALGSADRAVPFGARIENNLPKGANE